MLNLTWVKSTTGTWLPLETVDLANVKSTGVYVIWFAQPGKNVVRIGQGDIAQRLCAHRLDPEVLAFKSRGNLLVTWASVASDSIDGVERYLADQYLPLIGDRFPNVAVVPVNLAA